MEPGPSPLAKKLGIRAGCRVVLLDPPLHFARKLEPLPEGASVATKGVMQAEVLVLFASARPVLAELFPKGKHLLAPRGKLWVAWPRKSSGFFTDLDEAQVRAVGLAAGLVDDKIASLDEIWSALRFVEKSRARLPLPPQARMSAPPEA